MKYNLRIVIVLCIMALSLTCQPLSTFARNVDHEWQSWRVGQEPNCVDEGYQYRICEKIPDSPHYEYAVLPPTGVHTYKRTETPPTCTENGTITYTCSYCGDTYSEEGLAATGHQYGDWEVVREATEHQEGVRRRTCATDPTHTEEETIPILPITKKRSVVTPQPTEQPEDTITITPAVLPTAPTPAPKPVATLWNAFDIILAGSCLIVGGIFCWFIGWDLYVINWELTRRNAFINEWGYFSHVTK